jgi:peptidyl-prolyl cis-trans isomerase C
MPDDGQAASGAGKLFRELVRQPLVHFLVIGVALGAALQWFGNRQESEPDTTIRITAADIARSEAEWRSRWRRPPTQEELAGLVKARIRELVLYREAVAMGLDRDEPVIRRVLVQKLESIAKDLIELSLSPTDRDLEQHFAEHSERYRPASLITFTHVFVDPDARGDRAVEDAEKIVAELRSLGRETGGTERYGDPFMLQRYYPEKEPQRVASLFGAGFAATVFELPIGGWHGPVLSGYGLHAVYVHDRMDFPVPPLSEVLERVRQDWVDDNRRRIVDQYFADMVARYEVVIEGAAQGAPIQVEPEQGP